MTQISLIFSQSVDNVLIEVPEAARLGKVFLRHDMGNTNNDALVGRQIFQGFGFGEGLADINAGVQAYTQSEDYCQLADLTPL